ncbi:hypothetical protein KY312_02485, partial [Candidatus Woesearchaeota archaeon]|nr:hypothetical protein [Candidatus Woesearchaeota archaeon]
MEHKKILKLKKGKQSELLLKAINKSSSQRALSEILKIPRRTLRNYLCERNLIPLSLLQKLLQYLSMDLDAINANIEIEVEKNWGSKKGGLKSVAKLNNKSISNRMKHARSFRKNIIKKRIFEMNSSFYELYGILMGDGCISRYKDSEKMRRCDVF